jgi:hypothetical protein
MAEKSPKKSKFWLSRSCAPWRSHVAAIVDSGNAVIARLHHSSWCSTPSHRLWILTKWLHNSHSNTKNFTPCYFLAVFLPVFLPASGKRTPGTSMFGCSNQERFQRFRRFKVFLQCIHSCT